MISKSKPAPAQILSRADMIAELQELKGIRSLRKCAAEWGVDHREIHAVLKGDQYPGERLLEVLGLEWESDAMYVRVAVAGGKK